MKPKIRPITPRITASQKKKGTIPTTTPMIPRTRAAIPKPIRGACTKG